MRTITNDLIADIEADLDTTGIAHIDLEPLEIGLDHRNWCRMAEIGHMGPCRAYIENYSIPGVFGYTVVQYDNGRASVAFARCGHVDWNRLMTAVIATLVPNHPMCG